MRPYLGGEVPVFPCVDPLTKSYPMLTPYQFASNRPIDGIDLDGMEWTKIETYDPKTGVTNVHFHVKLKVDNSSKVFKVSQEFKAEVSSRFAAAFQESYHNDSKTSFSASIELEEVQDIDASKDFGVSLYDKPKPAPGWKSPLGFSDQISNTKVNVFSVLVGYEDRDNPDKVELAFDYSSIARTIVHELGHTAGVKHPMEPNGAPDVQLDQYIFLLPNGKPRTEYKPAVSANLDLIIKNIMVYGSTRVNGKTIAEHVPDPANRGNFSPDQSKEIQKAVSNEANN
jgi:predicted Zn-dependent protease